MKITLLGYLLWFACTCGKLLVAVLIVKNGFLRRWPSLFVLETQAVVRSSVLYFLTSPAHILAYRNIYNAGALVDELLGLWLIYDVLRAVPGFRLVEKRIQLTAAAVAAALAVGAFLALAQSPRSIAQWARVARQLNLAADIAWLVVFLSIVGCVSLLGMAWPRRALQVATALLAQALVMAVCAFLFASSASQDQNLYLVRTSMFLATLLYLASAFKPASTTEKDTLV